MYVLVVFVPIMVFLAYREGIRTGLALRESKLPPITPKAIKQAKEAEEQEIKAKNDFAEKQEKDIRDLEEALNFSNLYKVGDE